MFYLLKGDYRRASQGGLILVFPKTYALQRAWALVKGLERPDIYGFRVEGFRVQGFYPFWGDLGDLWLDYRDR